MKIIKTILALALFVVAIALGSENQEVVNFNYLIAQGEFKLSILLGIIFVIGFLVAGLFFASWYFKAQIEISRQRRQLKKLGYIDPRIDEAKKAKLEAKAAAKKQKEAKAAKKLEAKQDKQAPAKVEDKSTDVKAQTAEEKTPKVEEKSPEDKAKA